MIFVFVVVVFKYCTDPVLRLWLEHLIKFIPQWHPLSVSFQTPGPLSPALIAPGQVLTAYVLESEKSLKVAKPQRACKTSAHLHLPCIHDPLQLQLGITLFLGAASEGPYLITFSYIKLQVTESSAFHLSEGLCVVSCC